MVGLCYRFFNWIGRKYSWTSEKTSIGLRHGSSAITVVCTLSQLFCIFRLASNLSLFCANYIPHEIIKKVSWITFHPLYLEKKMLFFLLLRKIFCDWYICTPSIRRVIPNEAPVIAYGSNRNEEKIENNVEGSNPIHNRSSHLLHHSPSAHLRVNETIQTQLIVTTGDIVGRQFGEDGCMILLTLWLLPFTQLHLFPDFLQAGDPRRLSVMPSYNDIFISIVGGKKECFSLSFFLLHF